MTESFKAERYDDLLSSQQPALRIILKGIGDITRPVVGKSASPTSAIETVGEATSADKRPSNVFVIDGARGAGKTYTLTTVHAALTELCKQERPNNAEEWWPHVGLGVREALANADQTLCQPFRIVFPGDMEGGDTVMEAVFSAMLEQLTAEEKKLVPDARDSRKAKIDKLKKVLREEVAQGWYFARRFGLDAIVRDSIDYGDLVQRYEKESGRAAQRIYRWYSFVDEYVDFMGVATLVVMLDDSDVQPVLTENILHSIRMFLSSPRIITVLAGNIKSMRESLLHREMQRLGVSMRALQYNDSHTAKDWRRNSRKEIEEYLEKVLPPAKRIHISRPRLTAGGDRGREGEETSSKTEAGENAKPPASGARKEPDFDTIAARSLDSYMEAALSSTRGHFLKSKFRLAIQAERNLYDAPTDAEPEVLEAYLSWWFFRDTYSAFLAPKSARQIATFRDYYGQSYGGVVDLNARTDALRGQPRRLPVVLFENPANYSLIQRMGDEHESVLSWMRQQTLSSSWSGRRFFRINDREVHDGSYTYKYLAYRMDLGIAMPVRDNAQEVVPPELLPRPRGRGHMRRFFQPRAVPRRQRRLGVCRWVDHASIPGNCVYFFDLSALPDIAFTEAQPDTDASARLPGEWEAGLADRWFELVDDRQDEHLLRYFREVVCESLRASADVPTGLLLSELDPPDVLWKQRHAIYEHFLTDELKSFAEHSPVQRQVEWWSAFDTRESRRLIRVLGEAPGSFQPDPAQTGAALLGAAKPKQAKEGKEGKGEGLKTATALSDPLMDSVIKRRRQRRSVALYSTLVTDLRRAWHAIRIYEGSPGVMGVRNAEQTVRTSLSPIANRDRMTLYTWKELDSVLRQTPWVETLLKGFDGARIREEMEAIGTRLRGVSTGSDAALKKIVPEEADIGSIFSAGSGEKLTRQAQVSEEYEDFNRWTQTLRRIGRLACSEWKIYDVANNDTNNAEYLRHKIERELLRRPEDRLVVDQREKKDATEQFETKQKANAREARNFVWLLYGLAPSLAAVAHTQVMSLAYEALLQHRALAETQEYSKSPDKIGEEALLGWVPDQDRRRVGLRVKTLFDEASDAVDQWASLIGSISAILRYIKLKSLYLDASLLMGELLQPGQHEAFAELLQRAGYKPTESSEGVEVQALEQIRDKLSRLFDVPPSSKVASHEATSGGLKESKSRATQGTVDRSLAMFPDVAPSSLFGDQWFLDLLTRDSCEGVIVESGVYQRSKRNDLNVEQPLSVNGIFGETEQWLWSANRALRKLRLRLISSRKSVAKTYVEWGWKEFARDASDG